MPRFVALVFFLFVGCSNGADKGSADASPDGSRDAADAAPPGIDAGYFPGCRPSGAACADNLMSCCSGGCRGHIDLNNMQTSSCE